MPLLFGLWNLPIPALPLLLAGCVQLASPLPTEHETPTVTQSENDSAIMCGENLLKSFQQSNYALARESLAENLLETFDQKAFTHMLQELGKSLGEIRSFTYEDELKTPILKTLVWKVRFVRKSSDGGEIEQDALFRALVAAQTDGRDQIISFNFL